MFKKIFAIATVLCVIPVMANAAFPKWQLGTRAMTNGGTITSPNGTNQTVAAGAVFRAYTSINTATVTITAASGYKIQKISQNGSVSVPASSPNVITVTNTPPAPGIPYKMSIQAWFARNGYTVTGTYTGNGSINQSVFNNVYAGLLNPPKSFIFTPADINVNVTSVSINGVAKTASGSQGSVVFNILDATTGLPITLPTNNQSPLPAGSIARPIKVQVDILNVGNANVTVAGVFNGTPVDTGTTSASCQACHTTQGVGTPGIFTAWSSSLHRNPFHQADCYSCHIGANTAAHPGADPKSACQTCHVGPYGYPGGSGVLSTDVSACVGCHKQSTATGIHSVNTPTEQSCIVCHDVAIKHPGNVVSDNNGVRAIVGEFGKWSHHVTGVALQDAHCAACHMEGKVQSGAIVIDTNYHMADSKTHLRNADTNSNMDWDPAAPNHTTMDDFCMSCHDNNGANGIATIQAVMVPAAGKTANNTNPFGDTISNQYDQLERPAVVDAKGQFLSTNASHHAVRAPKYVGKDRATVAGGAAAFTANSSATLPGARKTIFEAGKFNASYVPLGAAPTAIVADNSQLHCGDCHTVGQWKTGSSKNIDGSATGAAIGAHGSNNEYMLRNTLGTDAKHTGVTFPGTAGFGANTATGGPYLVCFNCHAFNTYGTTGGVSGWVGTNHAGDYANQNRCNGPYNTINTAFGNMTGIERLESVKTNGSNGTLAGTTFGNMFGIQCANCHNSGISANNIFGGIHGSKDQTYIDGMGNTTKHYRFMPGLGNSMFVPGTKGGFTGGSVVAYNMYSGNYDGTGGTTTGQTFTTLPIRTIVAGSLRVNGATTATLLTRGSYEYVTGGDSNDANWEQQTQQTVSGEFDFRAKAMGCYTITPPGTLKSVTATGGASGDNVSTNMNRLSATELQDAGLPGPNGTAEMFDNWGGCDDHNGAQGAGTGIVRKVLRPVSY